MRVYDATEEWAYFYNPDIGGALDTCFTASNLTISNEEGSEVRFDSVRLAAFLPWNDESSFLDCIDDGCTGNSTAASIPATRTSGTRNKRTSFLGHIVVSTILIFLTSNM